MFLGVSNSDETRTRYINIANLDEDGFPQSNDSKDNNTDWNR